MGIAIARADAGRGTIRDFDLGLPIVRAIAEARGGRVTAGRRPTGGTAVTFTLLSANPQLLQDRRLRPPVPAMADAPDTCQCPSGQEHVAHGR